MHSGILCYSYKFSARTSVTCFRSWYVFHCYMYVRDKVVPRWIYVYFTALNLLYFKDLIVNSLYLSYTRKGSTETEGIVNKETYGAIKGTNSFV